MVLQSAGKKKIVFKFQILSFLNSEQARLLLHSSIISGLKIDGFLHISVSQASLFPLKLMNLILYCAQGQWATDSLMP